MSDKKYLSLNRLEQYDALIKAKIAEGDSNSINSSKSYTESYISSEINKLIDGTTVVAKATFATNASSATKATQDENENNISSTYETKTDASIKLTEAKGYTDTKIANLASTTVVENKISEHNTSASAHDDIRELIGDLETAIDEIGKRKEVYVGQDVPTDSYVQLWIDTSDLPSTSLSNFEEVYF